MPLEYLTLTKAAASLLAAAAFVGSGAGLVSLLDSSGGTVVLRQNQHRDTAVRRNTKLRRYGGNLYMEYSHLDQEQRYYIYDPLLEREAPYVYYLVNGNKKIIRLSPNPLPKSHRTLFRGWNLRQFKHPDLKTFYGYCHPDGGECNHLPQDWTIEPL